MLTLSIKTEWLDMLDKGVKPEEYRNITPYYDARLKRHLGETMVIKFRAGYCVTDRHSIYKMFVETGTGQEKWGAEKGKVYYRLKVVNCLEKKAKEIN